MKNKNHKRDIKLLYKTKSSKNSKKDLEVSLITIENLNDSSKNYFLIRIDRNFAFVLLSIIGIVTFAVIVIVLFYRLIDTSLNDAYFFKNYR